MRHLLQRGRDDQFRQRAVEFSTKLLQHGAAVLCRETIVLWLSMFGAPTEVVAEVARLRAALALAPELWRVLLPHSRRLPDYRGQSNENSLTAGKRLAGALL